MLTLTQAIELVFYTVKNARGGEIFVKKAPTTKIVNLARAYAELKTGKNIGFYCFKRMRFNCRYLF